MIRVLLCDLDGELRVGADVRVTDGEHKGWAGRIVHLAMETAIVAKAEGA
jgi:hypothetical protein